MIIVIVQMKKSARKNAPVAVAVITTANAAVRMANRVHAMTAAVRSAAAGNAAARIAAAMTAAAEDAGIHITITETARNAVAAGSVRNVWIWQKKSLKPWSYRQLPQLRRSGLQLCSKKL
jgi:hypothetical protein